MEEPRIKAFRSLKPPCVELSQLTLQYKGKKASSKDVIKSLEILLETLKTVSQQADALDSKLAEYTFFPLSHIFRDTKDLPVRAVELALQCLQILISNGWRANLSSDLGKQLLILLSFLAGGSATDAKVKEVNEELGTAAFDCLASLFEARKGLFLGSRKVSSQDVPVLGHAVTVMLDGALDGPSLSVRLAALNALDNLISGITDDEALKNVFPGIVSSLTKVLSSKASAKTSFRVLTASLATLTKILCKIINDDKNENPNNGQSEALTVIQNEDERDDSKSWVTATAAQVKMALANIIPLRYHERPEVRATLFQLCMSVIQYCRRSLSQSIPILIDTLIVLRSQPSEAEKLNIFALDSLLAADAGLLEIVKSSLHDWIVGLPRVMQGNDDIRKRRTIEQISTAFKILQNQDIRLDVLNDSMTANLRASVSAAIQASSQQIRPVSESSLEIGRLMQPKNARSQSMSFSPILFNESSSRDTITGLQNLAVQLKDLPMSTSLQQGLTNTLRNTFGDEQLASLWLSLQLLNNALSEMSAMDQFLDLPPEHGAQEQFLDNVYSFSLDVLGNSTFEDEDRWRLQCLALETVALQAQHQKYDFRPELVDALYPILERLGSNNSTLQHHAMTCLNIVSTVCSYPDPATLITDNADYLVNAIALKLNTFDISPQAPQVLVMMINLCGSSLIPYLDDLVESIFSILACYHGYPALVSSLFSVLNAIVEEASKSPTPTITENQNRDSLRPKIYKPITIPALASLLRSNAQQSTRPLSPPPSPPPEQGEEKKDPTNEEVESTSPPRPSTPPPPQPSKTHTLLTSIATLTPSHLTTPSPPLRISLLSLLTTAIPVLASNGTDTFLPIAATLYPALITRLFSFNNSKEEGGGEGVLVVTAAANALRVLCECAGDFLFSRVEEDWLHLQKLYERVERGMREEVRVLGKGKGKGREKGGKEIMRQGPKGLRWRAWDAVVRLILVIAREVGVSPEMEDGVFAMLGEWASERKDVRDVLEEVNADALWLVELREGRIEGLVRPQGVDGVDFRDVMLSLDK